MASKGKKKKRKTARHPQSDRQPRQKADSAKQGGVVQRSRRSKPRGAWIWVVVAIVGLIVVGGGAAQLSKSIQKGRAQRQADSVPAETGPVEQQTSPQAALLDGPALPLDEIQAKRLIINVHEHIQSLEYAPIYLDVMDELGIQKICLMGSSVFTLTLNEKYGFTKYDENNEELIKIINKYPGRFEAWTVINPKDPDKFEKFKALVARGATGLKLYVGHGFVTKENKYMFHTAAIDDRGLLPLYDYCEENYIPVCIHVNPYYDAKRKRGKPGFAEELIAVLTQFPDMKVDVPHFMLSSIKSTRLREYLDTFPNLYTDISYGDYFMAERLKYMSKYPDKFRKLFADHPDRIMYATDLVLTAGRRKTREWVHDQFQAYLDMLSKETYTTPAIPGVTLNGLALPDPLLNRVLYKNYEDFLAKRPKGTKITRNIDWARMGVTPVKRRPGQAFPPLPKKR